MSIPVAQANIVGVHSYATTDLGIAASLTSAQTGTSTPISTGTGATVVILSQLSSGSGTLKIDIADTAANINFGSPSQSVSLSGTSVQAAVQQTTASETYLGLEVTPGGSGIAWDTAAGKVSLSVLVLYERKDGQEWFNVASSINMFFSELNAVSHSGDTDTLADGSGNLPLNDMTKDTDGGYL